MVGSDSLGDLAEWLDVLRLRPTSRDADWYVRLDDWIVERPERLARLAVACMREGLDAHFDPLWGYLPTSDWPAIARVAVETLLAHTAVTHRTLAIEALEYCGAQQPAALHPYLAELFAFGNISHLGSELAFREATWDQVAFLEQSLRSPANNEERERAVVCLMETRLPEAFALVATLDPPGLLAHLPRVGFASTEHGFTRLYPDGPLHMTFAPDYFQRIQWYARHTHPTWRMRDDAAPTYRFGGWSDVTCGACGERVSHLVTLDPVPPTVGVSELERLELVACLSCIGLYRQHLVYQHDQRGAPSDRNDMGTREPWEWQVMPIEETRVSFASLGARWRWQDFALNSFENQRRLGGSPSWVQPAEYPTCPGCSGVMRFLLQLDGSFPLLNGQSSDYLWVAGDKGYIFWCDTCKFSTVMAQWT